MGEDVERGGKNMEKRREGRRKGGREEGGRGMESTAEPWSRQWGAWGGGELSPPPSLASLPPQTTLDHVQTQPSQSHLPRGLSPFEPVKTVSLCQQVT